MNDPRPLLEQAIRHFQNRQLPEAQAILEGLLGSGVRNLQAAELLGAVALQRGQPERAAQAFAMALSLRPGEPRNQVSFAIALNALGRGHEAEAVVREVLDREPGRYEAHFILATALELQGRNEQASEAARAGVDCDPRRIEGYRVLARLEEEVHHFAEARAAREHILERQPDHAEGWCDLARLCMITGDFEASDRACRRALSIDPAQATAHRLLSEIHRCDDPEDPDLRAALAVAQREDLPFDSVVEIHFALARRFDQLGEHDRAFDHARRANQTHHQRYRFDLEAYRDQVAQLIDTTQASSQQPGESGPLLIVGMPRSGTTLLEQMLDRHPGIETAGEQVWLPTWTRVWRENGEAGRPDLGREDYGNLLKRRGSKGGEAVYQIDKMPMNFNNLDALARLFPRAPVILLDRSSLDVCRSNYFTYYADGNFWANDIEDLVGYYREYRRLTAHWAEHPPVPFMRLAYEDLVREPRESLERALAFLGLEWDDRCLSHHESEAPVYTASARQVREPLHQEAIGRADPYRDYFPGLDAD